jgi:hypothetical protein
MLQRWKKAAVEAHPAPAACQTQRGASMTLRPSQFATVTYRWWYEEREGGWSIAGCRAGRLGHAQRFT